LLKNAVFARSSSASRLELSPRLLQRHGVADPGRDVIGGELEKVAVAIVERAARAHAGDHHAVRMLQPRPRQRQQDDRVRRFVVRATRQRTDALDRICLDDRPAGADHFAELPDVVARACGDVHDLQARRMIAGDADAADASRRETVALQQIDRGERHVDRIGIEDLRRIRAGVFRRLHVRRAPRQLAKRREAAFAFDTAGRLGDDGEEPTDAAGFIADRAVRNGEPAVLQVAVAFERQQPVVDRERLASAHAFELRPDDRPDFRKDLGARRAERCGMFGAEDRTVAIVIEEAEVRSPRDDHREAGLEHDADGRAKALRPL